MRFPLLLGLALLAASIILVILYAIHVDNFDGTVVSLLTAIAAYIGAREVVVGTTNNPTSN